MIETLFIINPASARGTTWKRWQAAKSKLHKAGIKFAEAETTQAGDAIRITSEAIQSGTKRVVAVGGDGTLNEVVNGYLDETGQPLHAECSIGLLPSGTGSDFRRTIGFLKTPDAICALVEGRTRLIDALRVEFENPQGKKVKRFALNVVTFGLGGETTRYVNHWRSRIPNWVGGNLRFLAAAVLALKNYHNKTVRLRIDDKQEFNLESNLLIVGNGRFAGGGMMVAPQAEVNDGLMDVVLTDGATRMDVIKELPRIYSGGLLKNPKASLFKATSVAIDADERLLIDIDGETAGFTPARLTVLPSVVRFLA
jgi:YegS/Rv2252/BmrU family lipid kinase